MLPLYLTAGLGPVPARLRAGRRALLGGLGAWCATSVAGWPTGWTGPSRWPSTGYTVSALARTVLLWPPGRRRGRRGRWASTASARACAPPPETSSSPPPATRPPSAGRSACTAPSTPPAPCSGPLLAFVALWAVPERLPAGLRDLAGRRGDRRGPARPAGARPAAGARRGRGGGRRRGSDGRVDRPAPVRMLAEPGFARLVGAAGLLGLLTLSDAFIYLVLQDRNDLAAQWFPLLFVGTNLAYLALAVPFGRVADRLGRGPRDGRSATSSSSAPTCAPPARLVRWSSAPCCLLLLGAFYASTDGVLAAAAASVVRPEVRGSAIATAQSAVALTRLAAAVVFGWAWTLVGPGRAALLHGGAAGRRRPGGVAGAASARPGAESRDEPALPTRRLRGGRRPGRRRRRGLRRSLEPASGADPHRTRPAAPPSAALAQVEAVPHLVYRSTALGPDYGKVAMSTLGRPGRSPRRHRATPASGSTSAAARRCACARDPGVVARQPRSRPGTAPAT